MPISDNDIVSMHNAAYYVQPQPPLFGVVSDRGGIDVLWENGDFQAGIALASSLDVIHDCSATFAQQQYIGKVVRISPGTGQSGAYDAIVVSAFRRQQGGDGSEGTNKFLVKLLSNGMYYEVTSAQIARLDDR